MSKHTPGPWTAIAVYEEEFDVVDPRGFRIVEAVSTPILIQWDKALDIEHWADSEDSHIELSIEEQNANARLIAAAPELLGVLEHQTLNMLLGAIEDMQTEETAHIWALSVQWMELRDAAIAKAAGESE